MVRISTEDLYAAAEWLDVNEGEDGEAESCRRVSDWLRRQIKFRHNEAAIRQVAKERGVRPAVIRHALKKQPKQ